MEKRKNETTNALKIIVKGAGIVFIGIIISKFLSLIYRIFIARYFGAEDYGIFSLAIAIVSFFYIFSIFGMPQVLTNLIAENLAKKNFENIKKYSAIGIRTVFILSIFLMIILFFSAKKISFFLKNDLLGEILPIIAISIPFYSTFYIIASIFLGFKKIEYKVLSEHIFSNSFKVFFTLFFGLLGFGLFGISVAYTLSWILTFLFSLSLLKNILKIIKLDIKSFFLNDFTLIKLSLPLLLTTFLATIIMYTDSIMIGYFKTAKDVGLYNAALPLAQILIIPSSILTSLFLPVISEIYIKESIESVKKIYKTVVRWTFYFVFPIYLLFLVFSKQVLYIIFGKEYISAYVALMILSSGYLFFFLTFAVRQIIIMFKKTKNIFYISLLTASTNVFMNLFLIPKFSINGAAFASFLSYFMGFIVYSYMIKRALGTVGIEKDYLIKSIFSAFLPASIIYIFKDFITISIPTVLLMFSLYILLYIFLLFIFRGFYKEDIEILLAIERKLGVNLGLLKKILRRFV